MCYCINDETDYENILIRINEIFDSKQHIKELLKLVSLIEEYEEINYPINLNIHSSTKQ